MLTHTTISIRGIGFPEVLIPILTDTPSPVAVVVDERALVFSKLFPCSLRLLTIPENWEIIYVISKA